MLAFVFGILVLNAATVKQEKRFVAPIAVNAKTNKSGLKEKRFLFLSDEYFRSKERLKKEKEKAKLLKVLEKKLHKFYIKMYLKNVMNQISDATK